MRQPDEEQNPLMKLFTVDRRRVGARIVNTVQRTHARVFELSSPVLPTLFLGRFPKTPRDLKKLKRDIPRLRLVISAVEDYEFLDMQTAADWKAEGVEHCSLPIPDHTAEVDLENLYPILQKMHTCIQSGGSVFVHCKGGRSRSSMVVAAYLHIYGDNLSVDEACSYVKLTRDEVDFRAEHVAVVRTVREYHRNPEHTLQSYRKLPVLTVDQNLDGFFACEETKRAIVNLVSLKQIKYYVVDKREDERIVLINRFLAQIGSATDAAWYREMLLDQGELQAFCEYDPNPRASAAARRIGLNAGIPIERLKLVQEFKDEICALVLARLEYGHVLETRDGRKNLVCYDKNPTRVREQELLVLPARGQVNFFQPAMEDRESLFMGPRVTQTVCGEYTRHPVLDDAEGIYRIFGIDTRREAYELIVTHMEEEGELLAAVTKEALLTREFAEYLIQNDFLSSSISIEYIQRNANKFSRDLAIIQAYLKFDILDKRVDAGWSHPDILMVLARIRGIALNIWQVGEDGALERFEREGYDDFTNMPLGRENNRVDLLLLNGNHFELLEFNQKAEKTAQVSRVARK